MAEAAPRPHPRAAQAVPIIVRELSRRRFLSARGGRRRRGLPRRVRSPGATARTGRRPAARSRASSRSTPGATTTRPRSSTAFTTSSGPKITLDSYGSNEELIAKLVAAKGTSGYDIVVPTGVFVPQMIENGLLAKFNKDLIPNLANIDPRSSAAAWDPDERLLDLQGLGHDRLRLRQDRDHARPQDLERLPRRRAERGQRQDVVARRPGRDRRRRTSGRTASTGTRPTPRTTRRVPRPSSSSRSPRTSRRSTRTRARAPSRRARRCSCRSWNGDARLGILNSDDPERWQWVLGSPTTELWMDNWAIADGGAAPRGGARVHQLRADPENALAELDYIGYNTGAHGHRGARPRRAARDARPHLLHSGAARHDARAASVNKPGAHARHLQQGQGGRGCVGSRPRPRFAARASPAWAWLAGVLRGAGRDGGLVQLRLQAGHLRHARERHPLVRPLRRGALADLLRDLPRTRCGSGVAGTVICLVIGAPVAYWMAVKAPANAAGS